MYQLIHSNSNSNSNSNTLSGVVSARLCGRFPRARRGEPRQRPRIEIQQPILDIYNTA